MVGESMEDKCAEYEERDLTGRYIRSNEVLGRGAFKTVYKAFDEVDGIEVAWNEIEIEEVVQSHEQLERLHSEVRLLQSLKHENIIKLYHSWVDEKRKTINMITELFTSGSLRQYRKKHKNVDMKAMKSWARQILRGLLYLHSHSPPIIHRDVKCDNIFINGHNGEVKIGDLGLATVMQKPTAHSVIGTPEFMAPEMYEEEYNELVDIYSFGMAMLEMVTSEYPYLECKNPAQIFRKVTMGIKPASLEKVKDPEVKQFIEKCILPSSSRLSAAELLKEPFLLLASMKEPAKPLNVPVSVRLSTINIKSEALPMDIDSHSKKASTNKPQGTTIVTCSTIELQRMSDQQMFNIQGIQNDDTTVKIDLHISSEHGGVKKFSFEFYINSDTAISVANEMVKELGLSIKDVTVVAGLIDELLVKLRSDISTTEATSSTVSFEGLHLCNDAEVADNYNYSRSTTLEEINAQESVISNKLLFPSSHHCGALEVTDMMDHGCPYEEVYMELKREVSEIEAHFSECYVDLLRRKQEAIENAKLKWLARKTTCVEIFPFSEAVHS